MAERANLDGGREIGKKSLKVWHLNWDLQGG